MRFEDLTYAVKDVVQENPRRIITIAVLVVVGITALIVLGRAVVPAPESQPDVSGLQERASRDDRKRIEAAQEERQREAERLRREVEAQGEDPNRDGKRPSGG